MPGSRYGRTLGRWLLLLLLGQAPEPCSAQSTVTQVTLNGENWLATTERTCEGVWVQSRLGSIDSELDCKAKCDEQSATQEDKCHSFAYCPDCTFTSCWICIHEPSTSSWDTVEASGITLYTPRSICPAGMAAPSTVTNVSNCLWCAAGWVADAQQTKCEECPVGKFAATCGRYPNSVAAVVAGQSVTCGDAFAAAPDATKASCPSPCVHRGAASCATCGPISQALCGLNGGCAMDGSSEKMTTEQLTAVGCRCKEGWTGALCEDEDGFKQLWLIIVIIVILGGCGCNQLVKCCSGKEGNTDGPSSSGSSEPATRPTALGYGRDKNNP